MASAPPDLSGPVAEEIEVRVRAKRKEVPLIPGVLRRRRPNREAVKPVRPLKPVSRQGARIHPIEDRHNRPAALELRKLPRWIVARDRRPRGAIVVRTVEAREAAVLRRIRLLLRCRRPDAPANGRVERDAGEPVVRQAHVAPGLAVVARQPDAVKVFARDDRVHVEGVARENAPVHATTRIAIEVRTLERHPPRLAAIVRDDDAAARVIPDVAARDEDPVRVPRIDQDAAHMIDFRLAPRDRKVLMERTPALARIIAAERPADVCVRVPDIGRRRRNDDILHVAAAIDRENLPLAAARRSRTGHARRPCRRNGYANSHSNISVSF